MRKEEGKKLIIRSLSYMFTAYLCDRISYLWRHSRGPLFVRITAVSEALPELPGHPIPSFHAKDLLAGLVGALFLWLVLYLKAKNRKNYRHGVEYGSARWGTAKDIAPFTHKDFRQNIPLTRTEMLSMESRPKDPKYARNKNIICLGNSGAGKTRFFIKPSLMQMHSSYVVTDPKGYLCVGQ